MTRGIRHLQWSLKFRTILWSDVDLPKDVGAQKCSEMMIGCEMIWVTGFGVVIAVIVLANAFIPLARRWQSWDANRAIILFHRRREMLEAKFFDIAKSLGKPRGLRWLDCEWSRDVTFGRDRLSGLLTAFVAVNIRFEAIEGGDMEDVAAVGTVRDAVALFHFHRGSWGTGGKALFNMNPKMALEKLGSQFDPVHLMERKI